MINENGTFCDTLIIEFSVNADFSNSYTRQYNGVVLKISTIENLISAERDLQNESDEHLHARITFTNMDPEWG
jgi:hypothetical protein